MRTYDVAVIGGGAMGAATAYSAVRRGASVVMLERFRPGHDRGSSHGRSRVFRLAYPQLRYIELAQRAHALWRALEDDVGAALLTQTGGIDHGPLERVQPIAAALEAAGVRADELSPAEAAERWSGCASTSRCCISRTPAGWMPMRPCWRFTGGSASSGSTATLTSRSASCGRRNATWRSSPTGGRFALA